MIADGWKAAENEAGRGFPEGAAKSTYSSINPDAFQTIKALMSAAGKAVVGFAMPIMPARAEAAKMPVKAIATSVAR